MTLSCVSKVRLLVISTSSVCSSWTTEWNPFETRRTISFIVAWLLFSWILFATITNQNYTLQMHLQLKWWESFADLSNAKDGPSDNSAIANGNEEDDKTTSEVPDSSQQKSLSFHEDPQLNVTVSPEVQEEIDVFEDTTSTPNISNAENTVQPKGILRFDKTPAPHISEINNFKKINLDKINEMDKFRTMIPLRVYGPYQLPSPDFQKAVKVCMLFAILAYVDTSFSQC